MDLLLETRRPMFLDEISERVQIPKSTVFRIVVNLMEHNYLQETESGYWLGLKLLSLGGAVEDSLNLRSITLPHLTALRDTTQETVHLAVLNDDMQVVYLEKLSSRQPMGIMSSRVGMTAPMHCTGLGKAMAAFKPEEHIRRWLDDNELIQFTDQTITDRRAFLEELAAIRARGYAFDNGEHEASIQCIATPILDRQGQVIAAISVAGPGQRMADNTRMQAVINNALQSAQRISEAIGFSGTLSEDL